MRIPLIISAVAVLTGCAAVVTAPQTDLTGLPEGFQVELSVDPATVHQSGVFAVTLTVRNTTADTIRITTSHGCLVTFNVMRDGKRIPFAGSGSMCTAAITTHAFPPGQTRTVERELRAELYAEHPGEVDGQPAPTGSYVVRAEFDVARRSDGTKPFIEGALHVR